MPLYEVSLSRTFVIKVEAKSARDAARLSEFFLGCADDSNERERKEYQFEFREIELVDNDVMEVNQVEN